MLCVSGPCVSGPCVSRLLLQAEETEDLLQQVPPPVTNLYSALHILHQAEHSALHVTDTRVLYIQIPCQRTGQQPVWLRKEIKLCPLSPG